MSSMLFSGLSHRYKLNCTHRVFNTRAIYGCGLVGRGDETATMRSNTPAFFSTLAFISLAAAAPASAQDSAPNYEPFREGVFLRYLNAHEGAGIDEIPRIGLSFGGRVH